MGIVGERGMWCFYCRITHPFNGRVFVSGFYRENVNSISTKPIEMSNFGLAKVTLELVVMTLVLCIRPSYTLADKLATDTRRCQHCPRDDSITITKIYNSMKLRRYVHAQPGIVAVSISMFWSLNRINCGN